MTTPFLIADLKGDEGYARKLPDGRCEAYPDPLSGGPPWTIGYGHTGPEVRPGLIWTPAAAEAALERDVASVAVRLDEAIPWWRTLCAPRQDVLANLAFNLGVHGLIRFASFLGLARRGEYQQAALDLLGTEWSRQVAARARRLSSQMATGEHAELATSDAG